MLFVIELHTSGPRPGAGAIWDLGAVAVQDGRVVSEWSSFVWPDRANLQAENLAHVQSRHGIGAERLLSDLTCFTSPEVAVARLQFLDWLYRHSGAKRVGEDVRGPKCEHPQCQGAGFWWEGPKAQQTQRFCPECRGEGRAPLPRTPLRITAFGQASRLAWLNAQPWQLGWFAGALGHAELSPAPCVMEAAAEAMGIAPGDNGRRRVPLARACEHFGATLLENGRAVSAAGAAAEIAIRLGLELNGLPSHPAGATA